jgi:hypothetical protein
VSEPQPNLSFVPTVLRSGPYRIYFVSHDVYEPPHVHVDRDDDSAKFWLAPVALAGNLGFTTVELRRVQRLIVEHESRLLEAWNEYSERRPGERVRDVRFTEDVLVVDLLDGRTISVPLVWYPRLLSATPEQRANWRVAGGGFGIHWPDVDEDLSTEGLVRGAPAPRGFRQGS